MYGIVGCSSCQCLWVIEPSGETTTCPRCGDRHRIDSLRLLAETEDADAARDIRSRLLADRAGFATGSDVASYSALEERADGPAIDDATYLEASGLDSAAIEEPLPGDTGDGSRRDLILRSVDELETPTADAIEGYAADRGVPTTAVRRALDRLVAVGELTVSEGEYRRL